MKERHRKQNYFREPEEEEPESIIGHNVDVPQKYLVKFVDLSFQKCKWLTEEELNSTQKGEFLLKYYKATPSLHKTEEPFYNPNYNEVDKIIDNDKQKYLVKWKNLPYTQLTVEREVPKDLLELYTNRKKAKFPSFSEKKSITIENIAEIPSEITLNDEKLHILSSEYVKTIYYALIHGENISLAQNLSFDAIKSTVWFIDFLNSEHKLVGPYLIVTDAANIEKWYSFLNSLPNISTVCFEGSPMERERIEQVEFSNKKKLSCHVILTTQRIIPLEFEFFNSITWRAIFYHKPLSQFTTKYSSQLQATMTVTLKHSTPINGNIAKSVLKCFQELESRNILDTDKEYIVKHLSDMTDDASEQEDSNSLKCYAVFPTLTAVQKQAARIILWRFRESIKQGKFSPISYAFERNLVHPFLVNTMEYDLGFPEFLSSSSALGIIRKIVEDSLNNGKRTLVSTNMISEYYLLIDFFGELGIKFKYDDASKQDVSTFLHANSIMSVVPSIDNFDTIIIIESNPGFFKMWTDHILNSKNTEGKKVYLISNYHTMFKKPSKMKFSDYICRRVALEAFSQNLQSEIDEILSNSVEFKLGDQIKKLRNSAAEHDIKKDDFWSSIEFSDKDIVRIPVKEFDNGYQFSVHERNAIVKTVSCFSWGCWHLGREVCGLNFSDEIIEKLCSSLILRLKSEKAPFSLPLFIDNACKPNELDIESGAFVSQQFFSTISRLSSTIAASLESANYIHSYILGKNIDDVFIPQIALQLPCEGWTQDYDRMLLYGVDKYGINMFDVFPVDENKKLRKIFKAGREISQYDGLLIKRVFCLAATIKKLIIDSKPDIEIGKIKGFEDWSEDEKRAIVTSLLRYGIPVDENGSKNYAELAAKVDISRSEEEIEKFVQKCLSSTENQKLAIATSSSVIAMSNLREILHTQICEQLFNKIPRWDELPEDWNSSHELEFFKELEKEGFGEQEKIFREKFPDIFKGKISPTILQKSFVVRRINKIHWFYSKIEDALKSKKKPETSYPIQVTESAQILNIGTVIYDRPAFHSDRYIYPAGYKSCKLAPSLQDPDHRVRWISEIVDTGADAPTFRVYQEDNPNEVFNGATPTAPWSQAMKAIASTKCEKGRIPSISGPEAFLLSAPKVITLIQNLPNAEKCTRYIFKQVYEESESSKKNSKHG
ncbi:F/Y-rich N-terminus family protein [Trichomonas vaginalis G3]|uniref:F/Y-rich N-terminus family protein n=1 Tax=Trichomonas vaginalis (strain ATCC PRA-98 / G3) TaxID=412133 RepID=A2FTX5_TRIV3|nr:histone methyltransferase activity (H3-K4 specific) [Trichomonas vaginalis G3]EAX91638.1 F/Y-rich N-terminus family protein [Trichomonas vaginalis G3]KAI5546050.1 histone methyltransferase activity (H3-K4 specific) [Trichomonas vaginalis G3]|eukprot:XP_001304568.1 F/Y-rich N-terminus family protein [Trichomonas vaginalis G3]